MISLFRSGSLILLLLVLLSGCSTLRWTNQWAVLPRIPVDEIVSVNSEPATQIFGFHGYRFGLAGAVISMRLDKSSIPWSVDSLPIMKVHLESDVNGTSFSGSVIRGRDGDVWLLGNMDRLTVRTWHYEGLLFTADEGPFPSFFLMPQNNFFDLDLMVYAEIPTGSVPYNCVASEAKVLALKEFKRVKTDAKNKRLSLEEVEYVQKRMANYLSANTDLCSRFNHL